MTGYFEVLQAGPGLTLQDAGRTGGLADGLSRGGAMDVLALAEAAALFGQDVFPALEMPLMGGRFRAVGGEIRVALTGAKMVATIDGAPARWAALHIVPEGGVLSIGAVTDGQYGYLSVAGGFPAPVLYGSASARPGWEIGAYIVEGDRLRPRLVSNKRPCVIRDPFDRLDPAPIRVLDGPQTGLFPENVRAAFFSAGYTHGGRSNRVGVGLADGPVLSVEGALSLVSDAVVPGDIQAVGAGEPYILLADCQTTGGYPRIGTVVSADLARVAQRPPGSGFRFVRVTRDEALEARGALARYVDGLPDQISDIDLTSGVVGNLLDHNLISGATAGNEEG